MKQVQVLLLSLVTLLMVACNEGGDKAAAQAEAQQALRDEVMAIHDEVMPRMGEIHRHSRDLNGVMETTNDLPESFYDEVELALEELDEADEEMMEWMSEFEEPHLLREKGEPHDAIMKYLAKEKVRIEQVQEEMNSSIATAERLLEQLQELQE